MILSLSLTPLGIPEREEVRIKDKMTGDMEILREISFPTVNLSNAEKV